VGKLSYWISEGSGLEPGSIDDALRRTGLELWHEEGEWVTVAYGFPREWHKTRDAAEKSAWAERIDHVPGGTWLVMTGDQYVFSSPSRDEVEGFVFGVLAGSNFAHQGGPDWLSDR
jgi:hypothetical protein